MTKRIGGTVLAFAAVAVFATACGGSSGDTPAGNTAASGGTDYASCLRNNGVNIPQFNPSNRPTDRPTARPSGQPRPSGSGGFRGGGNGGLFGTAAPSGVPQETWDKAQKACASLRPTAFPSGGFGNGGGGGRDAAYRNCLTEHGVTVNGPTDQLSTADPATAAAVTACAPLKPSPRTS